MSTGIIKVLNNLDLGGNTSTPVYPVTSTKAVYNKDNQILDDILTSTSEQLQITQKITEDNTDVLDKLQKEVKDIAEQVSEVSLTETAFIPVFDKVVDYATAVDGFSESAGFVVYTKQCVYENTEDSHPTFLWYVPDEQKYYKDWYNSYQYKDGEDIPYINKIFENHRDKQQYYFDGNQLNTFGNIKIDEQIKTHSDGVISGDNILTIENNTQYSGFFMGTVSFSLPDVTDVNCVVEVWKVPVYGGGEYSGVIATQFLYSNNMEIGNQSVAIPFIFKCSNPMNIGIKFKNNNTSDLTFTNFKTEIFKLN